MRGGKEDLLLQDMGPAGDGGGWAALHRWHRLPVFGGCKQEALISSFLFLLCALGDLGSPEKGWTQALSRATGHS